MFYSYFFIYQCKLLLIQVDTISVLFLTSTSINTVVLYLFLVGILWSHQQLGRSRGQSSPRWRKKPSEAKHMTQTLNRMRIRERRSQVPFCLGLPNTQVLKPRCVPALSISFLVMHLFFCFRMTE